jgi:pentatricopeptide repeat protein
VLAALASAASAAAAAAAAPAARKPHQQQQRPTQTAKQQQPQRQSKQPKLQPSAHKGKPAASTAPSSKGASSSSSSSSSRKPAAVAAESPKSTASPATAATVPAAATTATTAKTAATKEASAAKKAAAKKAAAARDAALSAVYASFAQLRAQTAALLPNEQHTLPPDEFKRLVSTAAAVLSSASSTPSRSSRLSDVELAERIVLSARDDLSSLHAAAGAAATPLPGVPSPAAVHLQLAAVFNVLLDFYVHRNHFPFALDLLEAWSGRLPRSAITGSSSSSSSSSAATSSAVNPRIQLLLWASSLSSSPSSGPLPFSFTVLLQSCARDGRVELVQHIMHVLQAKINADAAAPTDAAPAVAAAAAAPAVQAPVAAVPAPVSAAGAAASSSSSSSPIVPAAAAANPLYCVVCDRLFTKGSGFAIHLTEKKHKINERIRAEREADTVQKTNDAAANAAPTAAPTIAATAGQALGTAASAPVSVMTTPAAAASASAAAAPPVPLAAPAAAVGVGACVLQFTSDHFLWAMVAWNQMATREFHSPPVLRAAMPSRASIAGGAATSSSSASASPQSLPPHPLSAPEYAHAHVLSLWREMIRRDLPRGERVLTALLRSMSLVGASERAEKLINHMMAGQRRRRDTTTAVASAAAATPTGGMVGPVAGHEARPSALSFAHAYVACMLDGSVAAEARGQRMLQLCHEALKLPVTLSSPSSRATSAGGAASSFTIDPQAAGQLSDADFLAAQKIYLSVLLPSLQLKRQWAACVESVERLEAVADAMAVHRRQRQQQRQQQAASSATAVEGDTASSAVADEYVSPKLLPALYNQAMECCDVSYQAPACVRLMRSLLARQGPAAVELQHYNTLLRALVRVRDWPAALEVLDHMRASGGENGGVRPTLDTWRRVNRVPCTGCW